jgi:hypothetical protein
MTESKQAITILVNGQEYQDFIFDLLRTTMRKYPDKTFEISTKSFCMRGWKYACIGGNN